MSNDEDKNQVDIRKYSKHVKSELEKLFISERSTGKTVKKYAKKNVFIDSKFEDDLKDLIARGFQPYTIKKMLKEKFGSRSYFKARNILGYINSEILQKTENLETISSMRWKLGLDRKYTHHEIELEQKEIKDNFKDEISSLKKDIADLYTRIKILKEENSGKMFSSKTESQITANYETIMVMKERLKMLRAEKSGLIVNLEEVRDKTIKSILSISIQCLLPLVPQEQRNTALSSFKTEVKRWVDNETKLNQLESYRSSSTILALPKRRK